MTDDAADVERSIRAAAEAIRSAEALIIGAGAGMGVDSGLPDFRGNAGFWRAYPPYQKLGLDFASMANPRWFAADPEFAWGFYGHRLELYRRTRPHEGFAILKAWAGRAPHGAFVFTSNVDGQFQRAGFADDRVVEIHGSIHHVQCTRSRWGETPHAPRREGCRSPIAPADPHRVEVDQETFRAAEPLPSCPACDAILRPNILMFGDGAWDASRTEEQEERLEAWLDVVEDTRLVVIECGAGTAIPSVRTFCERWGARGTLIRINVREPHVPDGGIGLAMGALEALGRIAAV